MKKRRVDLDLIRTFAILMVLTIHGMMGSPFYTESVLSWNLYSVVSIILSKLSYTCVPLFLMLTGALCKEKTDYKKYYKRQISLLLIYLFWSVIVFFYFVKIGEKSLDKYSIVSAVFGYGSQDRAWYMNMYFGLALLIPFINYAWKNIKRREKQILLILLFMLGSVSPFVQLLLGKYGYNVIIISSYYSGNIYFVFYYLLGAYAEENKERINKIYCFIVLGILLVSHSILYIYLGEQGAYASIWFQQKYSYQSYMNVIYTYLIFCLFIGFDCRFNIVKRILAIISMLAMDIYLVSFIPDSLNSRYLRPYYYSKSYYLVLGVSILFSLSFSLLCGFIRNSLSIGWGYLIEKIRRGVMKGEKLE